VTLRDGAGRDWSAYFAKQPAGEWQKVALALADFRGDTSDTPEHGKPLPVGTQVTRVSFILRKGETQAEIAPAMELDEIVLAY